MDEAGIQQGMAAKPPGGKGEKAIRRYLIAGLAVFVLLIGGVGGIAAVTELSGAIIAPGVFVVHSYVKKVQHPTGGIIGEINVRDGATVKAGQSLARLDDTQTRANLAIVTRRLDEFAARRARLEAERDDLPEVTFPPDLARRTADPVVASLMRGEARLFTLRREARIGKKEQLESRIGQLQQEKAGLVVQSQSKAREIELITRELTGVRGLWEKDLVSLQRMTAGERDAARLDGERGQLLAAQAQADGRISETRLQVLSVDQDSRSDVAKELREIEAQASEYAERRVSAEDQLRHVDILAPQDGVVHQLAIHTVGGVVSPAEPLMLIVPVDDALRLEAKVAPQDIDQVKPGQRALVRLSAFNQRLTPEVFGTVLETSPDLTIDPKSGAGYYSVRLQLEPAAASKLGDLKIVPGMPAEVFFQTSPRTILSYLVKPLHDQMARAFREE